MIIPFFSSVFTLLLASRVRGECQATTVANDIQAGQSATISSQTAAHVKAGGTAFVEPCGTAVVQANGLATISGGVAVLAGRSYGPFAYATITSYGSIYYASGAMATVLPGATVTVDSAPYLDMRVGDGAYVQATGGPGNQFQLHGGSATLHVSDAGFVAITGSGGYARIEGTGGLVYASGAGATGIASATDGDAAVESGGRVSMTGQRGFCSLGYGGTCTIAGTSQFMYCLGEASADILGGPGNYGDFGAGCTGTVSGYSNRVTVDGQAEATIAGQATATVSSAGRVYVRAGVYDVSLESGATATMEASATVYAKPGATVTGASPFIEVRSVSQDMDYDIYIAQQVGTGMKRRMMPEPTPRCAGGKVTCPDLRGGWKCVDPMTDLFNCGGCNFGSNSLRVGVDCTELYDGNVACIAGQCVPGQ